MANARRQQKAQDNNVSIAFQIVATNFAINIKIKVMNIIKCFIATSLVLSCFNSIGQKPIDKFWSNKYDNLNYSAWDYISVAEKVNWKPKQNSVFKGSFELFEKIFIKVCTHDGVLKQLEIDGWANCSRDHEYLFEKYNRTYNKISKEAWDEYCPILYSLMSIDK